MTDRKKTKIDIRRYVNYFLLMVVIVLLCLIGIKIYKGYESNKLDESVLTRVVGTIQFDDIDNAKKELVSDDFILISYVRSVDVRKLESKLKKHILKYDLQNNFYYLDATDLMLEENYIDLLNEKFNLKDNDQIKALPAIIYYKDGEFVKTLSSSEDTMLSNDDFLKLLDNYEIIESD